MVDIHHTLQYFSANLDFGVLDSIDRESVQKERIRMRIFVTQKKHWCWSIKSYCFVPALPFPQPARRRVYFSLVWPLVQRLWDAKIPANTCYLLPFCRGVPNWTEYLARLSKLSVERNTGTHLSEFQSNHRQRRHLVLLNWLVGSMSCWIFLPWLAACDLPWTANPCEGVQWRARSRTLYRIFHEHPASKLMWLLNWHWHDSTWKRHRMRAPSNSPTVRHGCSVDSNTE